MSNSDSIPLLGQGHPGSHLPFDVCVTAAKGNAIIRCILGNGLQGQWGNAVIRCILRNGLQGQWGNAVIRCIIGNGSQGQCPLRWNLL